MLSNSLPLEFELVEPQIWCLALRSPMRIVYQEKGLADHQVNFGDLEGGTP